MKLLHARGAHRALISAHHWKSRILLWIAAAAVGAAAVGFAKFADLAQATLRHLLVRSPHAPWILAPLGFCGIAWATRRFFRGAEGSGIPQVIHTLRPDCGDAADRLHHVRVVAGRIVLAGAGLLCGGSIGREGPTVHVGAAITHAFGRWMPHGRADAQRRALILAGGAAGVAAAFNTPLAGIVFAIEELSRSFEERASGTTLTAVILSGVVAIALVGDYTYFGQPMVSAAAYDVSFGTFMVAIAGGLAGALFSRLTLAGVGGLPSAIGRLQRQRPAIFAALCGLTIAAIGWATGGLTYGTGYAEARSILVGHAHLPWFYAPARALASLAAYLSGVPAGLLSPSLSVGAGLGQLIADLARQSNAVPFAILGMCGYLAGVTQAPLTSLVIVMEMTTTHEMVLPLMVTAAVSTAVAKVFSPPLYRALADRYAAATLRPSGTPSGTSGSDTRSGSALPSPMLCADAAQPAPDSPSGPQPPERFAS